MDTYLYRLASISKDVQGHTHRHMDKDLQTNAKELHNPYKSLPILAIDHEPLQCLANLCKSLHIVTNVTLPDTAICKLANLSRA